MRKPKLGDDLWYWLADPSVERDPARPCTAKVAFVDDDHHVTVGVITQEGVGIHAHIGILFRYPDEPRPIATTFCEFPHEDEGKEA